MQVHVGYCELITCLVFRDVDSYSNRPTTILLLQQSMGNFCDFCKTCQKDLNLKMLKTAQFLQHNTRVVAHFHLSESPKREIADRRSANNDTGQDLWLRGHVFMSKGIQAGNQSVSSAFRHWCVYVEGNSRRLSSERIDGGLEILICFFWKSRWTAPLVCMESRDRTFPVLLPIRCIRGGAMKPCILIRERSRD